MLARLCQDPACRARAEAPLQGTGQHLEVRGSFLGAVRGLSLGLAAPQVHICELSVRSSVLE